MNAPEAVTPVTLWRGDHYEGDSFFLSESKHQRREEWKALPVDAYDALVAENARLREALKQVDRALWDVIGCVEDLNDCEGWHGSDPHSRSGKLNDACAKARTALGAERA